MHVAVGLVYAHDPSQNNNGNTDADLYPSFLMQQPSVAASYCVGLGLIKLIDPERRCFYIVTPVPPEKLKNVNTIVRGSLEFPASILVKVQQLCDCFSN